MASPSDSASSSEASGSPSGGAALLEDDDLILADEDRIPLIPPTNPSETMPVVPEAGSQPETATGLLDARAYQREMFAASMQRNIILAMDTGSGKTQVAVLRIRAELDRTGPDKIVWFLAPTVQLCNQQDNVLRTQIPAVQIKMLQGQDNIKAWSDQGHWDACLLNVRVVVSTPQILADAMAHAFVEMDRLSLIVFDEAHNSVKNSSCSKIMRDYYHPRKANGAYVPHILGMTASPIMNSNIDGLESLERTLDAVCRSPTVHRIELLAHVKKPRLGHASYDQGPAFPDTPSLASLLQVFRGLDITEDPHILHLKSQGTDRSRRELIAALDEHNTYIQKQMLSFCQRARKILHDLGPWAADLYISRVIDKFRAAIAARELWLDDWKDEEKQYLLSVLNKVQFQGPITEALSAHTVTGKVAALMKQLLLSDDSTVGLIFVKERTTASILAEVISSHPATRERFPRVGAMAGTSQYTARKRDIWDLFHGDDSFLQHFRAGKLNLLISTSVLEEGIDVPSCNLVICFDKPPNLKSFIQIRGRARERDSKLIVLLDAQAPVGAEWEHLETVMKRQYEDQERELKILEDLEELEETSSEIYVVEATGARLTHDEAKGHLSHFCAGLSPGQYIDSRPDYITQPVDDADPPSLKTTVFLPSYIPAGVRRATSKDLWKSAKNSTKDAAFQAYIALHQAGLVNDHLLPLQVGDLVPQIGERPALVQVNGLLNVWLQVARAWDAFSGIWSATVTLTDPQGVVRGEYDLFLPVWLPDIPSTPIYFSHEEVWTLSFGPLSPANRPTRDHTAVLLALNFQHRWACEDRQQVATLVYRGADLDINQLSAKDLHAHDEVDFDDQYLVRDRFSCPYIFEKVIPTKPQKDHIRKVFRGYDDNPGFDEAPDDVPYLALRKWPRRADFLHRPPCEIAKVANTTTKPFERVYPITWSKVDTIHLAHARFGLLIPSILHHIEVRLVAAELSSSLLRDVAISDLYLVQTAISAGVAREPTNYERLELLGDTILKLCTTMNVAALNPDLPEGYLSIKKDGIVSNSRLCRAALDRGLDRFILTRAFTGHKWRPKYVDDILTEMQSDSGPREMSSKTLADVVEALIGASYHDGGLLKALECIRLFIGGLQWMPLDDARQTIYDFAPADESLPSTLAPLEELLGYSFQKKSLLVEATTHASFNIGLASGCLERLEFLGDAVLDYIVVKHLFGPENLAQHDVHLLKTATVNGDFLAFMCLEHHLEQEQTIIIPSARGSDKDPNSDEDAGIDDDSRRVPGLEFTKFRLPLWKFMRHSSAGIDAEQKVMEERHASLRDPILDALQHGQKFPWTLLARLQAGKFYSDLLEAIIGAVWIDSGDMDACVDVVRRFGILPVLERLIRDKVHILHPKQEMGEVVDCSTVKYEHYKLEADGRARCRILVGARSVVDVEAGGSKLETETIAAEAALEILKEERRMAQTGRPDT